MTSAAQSGSVLEFWLAVTQVVQLIHKCLSLIGGWYGEAPTLTGSAKLRSTTLSDS